MILRRMTPVEIDSSLVEIIKLTSNKEESIRRLKIRIENLSSYNTAQAEELTSEMLNLQDELGQLNSTLKDIDSEFTHRGGWPRYYFVGHLHTSRSCSSLRITTQIRWLPEYSGRAESEIIAMAGSQVCTRCVPEAPTEPKRPIIPALAEAWDKANNKIFCVGSSQRMNRNLPFREGYAYGNWATCHECKDRIGITSTSLLRKQKPAKV